MSKKLYSLSAFAFKVADLLKDLPNIKSGLASLLMESGQVNQAMDILHDSSKVFEEKQQKSLLFHNLGVGENRIHKYILHLSLLFENSLFIFLFTKMMASLKPIRLQWT